MKLPQISYPTLSVTLPRLNKAYSFRPMLVKEEKLLLMAKVAEDETDILSAIKQVVNNCSIDSTFNVDLLPLWAVQYIFIKLRGFSIDTLVKVGYRDYADDLVYNFEVDLNKVEVMFPEGANNKIEITPSSGIVLKEPPATVYDDKEYLKSEGDDSFYRLVIRCIDQVYDGAQVFNGSDFTEAELADFLELLDIKSFEKVRSFMFNLPTLYYKLEYTNSLGTQQKIELKELTDFFTLR